MKQSDYTYSSLPNDVALKIASSLEVPDLSSLGCCSRIWRDLCGSDYLWESLVKERWPPLYEAVLKDPDLKFKGRRGFYIKQHEKMRDQAASVVKFVEQCSLSESLEASLVMEALQSSKISDRQVCVKWWKLGRWFYGFRMRDESHSRCVSLEDLATAEEEEVLGVLDRGAIHEVLRVQISFASSTSNLWSTQSPQ
ncbi:hypothetical protein CRYUN_Cryun18bG0018500 [Craigia yunnanensis]